MEKDCIFLLADKQMEYAFKGFLERSNFHLSLGIRPFTYEIIVDPASDPGVYTRGHELLRLYYQTHRHAIVVLDNDWHGSPGAVTIQATIKQRLAQNGWSPGNVEVVVIVPELEIWLCQDSPHVAEAFRFDPHPHPSLRKWLEAQGLWLPTERKPTRPKEAFERMQRKSKMPRSGAIYSKITRTISVSRCMDPAFCLLRDALQRWFPLERSDYDTTPG